MKQVTKKMMRELYASELTTKQIAEKLNSDGYGVKGKTGWLTFDAPRVSKMFNASGMRRSTFKPRGSKHKKTTVYKAPSTPSAAETVRKAVISLLELEHLPAKKRIELTLNVLKEA